MKKKAVEKTTLFVDIGGVLLTNGWDRKSRELAAKEFGLDLTEMTDRHRLVFDTYEIGKITLKEYLKTVVFYEKRNFSIEDFERFMYAQSKPFPEMFHLLASLKEQYGLKVVALSNEGRELTEYRVREFKLNSIFDFYVSSCFVHLKKPDPEIYHMALDLSQARPSEVVYLDDRALFVQLGESLGISSIQHSTYKTTEERFAALGLKAHELASA